METFSALVALCEGNPVFSSQRPFTRSFDALFDMSLNIQLSKQSRHRWFETPSISLWRHCYANVPNDSPILDNIICVSCHVDSLLTSLSAVHVIHVGLWPFGSHVLHEWIHLIHWNGSLYAHFLTEIPLNARCRLIWYLIGQEADRGSFLWGSLVR